MIKHFVYCVAVNGSYEDMPEIPVAEEETSFSHKLASSIPPETRDSFQDYCSASESYDDVDEVLNGEVEWYSSYIMLVAFKFKRHKGAIMIRKTSWGKYKKYLGINTKVGGFCSS